MIGRIVEIAQDGRRLTLSRGFLVIKDADSELGRVPIDDIGALIVNGHGVTFSNNLVHALSERGASLILCGPNHAPYAWLWPISGHHMQGARMRAQLAASKPLRKRLWQIVVRAKIEQQGAALEAMGRPGGAFRLLARKVGSGDPENVEAQAARRYWPLMFGESFRRERDAGGLNALLNYGYAVLRSCTARAVTGAGLHPSLAIHHRNRANDMALVDDLMEPFRPLVDLAVARLAGRNVSEVTPEAKRTLANLAFADMRTSSGVTPLSTCLTRLAVSLAQAFENGEAKLELPLAPLPLELDST